MRPPVTDLLCLPWAGASATAYSRWQRRLPSWIRVVPVELAGRGVRLAEPMVEDFDRSVAELCEGQGPAMQGRYALFGHSMGALLAYAIAQRQRALGRPLPRALFASGSPAPSCGRSERLARHSEEDLVAELRKQGGTPEEVFGNAELLRMALDTLRADYRVCESFRHRPREPLPLPIHAFAGREDDVAVEQLEAWRYEANGLFTIDWFDGGHFFVRRQEDMVLAAIERQLLRQAGAGRSAFAIT